MADLTNTIIDGDPFSAGEGGGSGVGHEYDLVQNNAHDETTLTEDGVGKTTLPLVATFVGRQAEWNALSASEQAAYRIVHITDDAVHTGNISRVRILSTNEDLNNLVSDGNYFIYAGSQYTNRPPSNHGTNAFIQVYVMNDNGGSIIQEYYEFYSGVPAFWIRRKFEGNWSSWFKYTGIADA